MRSTIWNVFRRSVYSGCGSGQRCDEREAPTCGKLQSPLPDSNRRPPPYHGEFALSGRGLGSRSTWGFAQQLQRFAGDDEGCVNRPELPRRTRNLSPKCVPKVHARAMKCSPSRARRPSRRGSAGARRLRIHRGATGVTPEPTPRLPLRTSSPAHCGCLLIKRGYSGAEPEVGGDRASARRSRWAPRSSRGRRCA